MKKFINKFNLLCFSIFLVFSITEQVHSQSVQDDFEGNGNITTWYGDACGINTNLPNPHQTSINTSATVLEYHDTGGQYANVRFDTNGTFDLSSSAVFSFKIYVPSSGITGNQTNQVSLKLQDGTLPQPWVTQTEIVKPIELDQWQTLSFDFENDNYINFDPNSLPPIQRNDFNRVLFQINGENNYDHVLAYIDDVLYDNPNEMLLLQSNDRFEFWGLNSEQQAADVLMIELTDNYNRVADSLNTTLPHKIKVYVYQDLQTYHNAIGWPNAPDWGVGNASGDNRIDMVTPFNPGPAHNYDSILLVVTHEMVHNFVFYIKNGNYVSKWLNEGTAVYLAEQHQGGFCTPINSNNGIIPTLDELNDGSTFGSIGGYQIAPTIAEFISEEFGGSEMISQLIASGMDYSVLGLSNQQEFQDEWNQYVFINYPCNYAGLHAVFKANQVTGDYPLTVNFSDFSLPGDAVITNWSWDFDNDGTIDSYAQNPTWTYNQPGVYSVTLTVNNSNGSDTYTKHNYIEATSSDYSMYFTDYDLFISKLNELTSSTNHAAELDQFWNELVATGNFPFAIDTEVAFLYRGTANSVNWAGDFNGSNPNVDPGIQLGVSNIWLLEKIFPSDARLSYKIVKNGSVWIADEHNPNPLGEEWGNSSLRMPDYVVPLETIFDPYVPTGILSNNILITSTHLGYSCQYRVYTPAGYSELSNLPVIYVTDGQNFSNNTFGKMRIVLDNLINDETIEPVIAVFLDPRDPYNLSINRRSDEYRNNINFVNYVTQELIPIIDANYNTDSNPSSRAIAGSSYGGYNAAYFLAKASDQIQNNAILSPIMHPNPQTDSVYDAFIADLTAADLTNSNIYMSYGIFHPQEDYYFETLENIFNQKGKAFEYDIVHDGHNYFNWNGVIGDALEYFFPAQNLSITDSQSTFDFKIYPNPATDRVFVSVKEKALATLYTIYGQKVLEKVVTQGDFIDVAALNKGVYLVLIKNNEGMKTKKLIIK